MVVSHQAVVSQDIVIFIYSGTAEALFSETPYTTLCTQVFLVFLVPTLRVNAIKPGRVGNRFIVAHHFAK
ncbi:MAG: hypothetical protein BWK78_06860 [Thiotrichaceae bacterium IS1]|nr:MAG: hypothetical protein BWK78_06860 [Thiotrichaceae bacterium IS1]